MIVYKFGGASVKDSSGIRNLGEIVKRVDGRLVVVVSALGKTTNSLEDVLTCIIDGTDYTSKLSAVEEYHRTVLSGFPVSANNPISLEDDFSDLRTLLGNIGRDDSDFLYDQVVSYGEIWSTKIVNWWLQVSGLGSEWIDIRKFLITDCRYRDANVNWEESRLRIGERVEGSKSPIVVTQGFIGGTLEGNTTTLGREGSDFTAAIIANILDADSVTIWKDVPGVLNADPEWLDNTEKLNSISYKEAVEMSFSGAKVIHPKTIKPLHNKGIPLHVRSFLDIANPGTVISVDKSLAQEIPLFVKKEQQVLVSFIPKDFSFVLGDSLGNLFNSFYKNGIKTNLVQASAISIAVCVDDVPSKLNSLIESLETEYKILVNRGVEILTLRYYNDSAIEKISTNREVLLEQRTRRSVRYVVKQIGVE